MKLYRTDMPRPPYWPPQSDPRVIASALHYARYRDRYGNVAHQIFAMAFCFTLPFSTAANGVTFALLAIFALLRTPHTWRCYNSLLRSPMLGAIVAFIGWYALSILWSDDARMGLDELTAARVMALPIMIWPVIDKAHWYIAAALAGVFAQNVVQLLQFFELLEYEHGASGRLGGWVHPIQIGGWCAAAVCWHCSAFLTAHRLSWRVISIAGLITAGVGMLASGSRGPWIAAAVAVPVVLLIVTVRQRSARRGAALVLIAGVVVMAGALLTAPGFFKQRIGGAIEECSAAVSDQQYWTSTGSRIGFWKWSIDICKQSPVIGTGAGSFPDALRALPEYQQTVERARLSEVRELEGYDDAVTSGQSLESLAGFQDALHAGERRIRLYLEHDHAHSSYFHTLAGTGIVGLTLLLAMLALIARRCLVDPRTHPYVDGTLAVLVVWCIGAQFDCFHLNGHLFGMLGLIASVTLPNRVLIEDPS